MKISERNNKIVFVLWKYWCLQRLILKYININTKYYSIKKVKNMPSSKTTNPLVIVSNEIELHEIADKQFKIRITVFV